MMMNHYSWHDILISSEWHLDLSAKTGSGWGTNLVCDDIYPSVECSNPWHSVGVEFQERPCCLMPRWAGPGCLQGRCCCVDARQARPTVGGCDYGSWCGRTWVLPPFLSEKRETVKWAPFCSDRGSTATDVTIFICGREVSLKARQPTEKEYVVALYRWVIQMLDQNLW